MNKRELTMIGHGGIVMLIALLAGFGLVMELIGGFEIIPTYILPFNIPGDSAAWVRAHVGGITNGLLIFAVALLMHNIKFSKTTSKKLYWMLIGTGYANTLFYWGGLLAGGHRALTVGNNRLGETSLIGIIGYVPALIFSFVLLYATFLITKEVFQKAKQL